MLELVDYISAVNSKFSEAAMQEITKIAADLINKPLSSVFKDHGGSDIDTSSSIPITVHEAIVWRKKIHSGPADAFHFHCSKITW